jgi:hypothetical protein
MMMPSGDLRKIHERDFHLKEQNNRYRDSRDPRDSRDIRDIINLRDVRDEFQTPSDYHYGKKREFPSSSLIERKRLFREADLMSSSPRPVRRRSAHE